MKKYTVWVDGVEVEEHYYCWIYNDNNLPEKHIYAHALKLDEIINNV